MQRKQINHRLRGSSIDSLTAFDLHESKTAAVVLTISNAYMPVKIFKSYPLACSENQHKKEIIYIIAVAFAA